MTGFHYADIEKMGYLLMVTGLEVRYRRSARYGDTVTVTCRGRARLASRGLRFAYEVKKGDELLATGFTDHLWIEMRMRPPFRIPEALREPFVRLLAGDAVD